MAALVLRRLQGRLLPMDRWAPHRASWASRQVFVSKFQNCRMRLVAKEQECIRQMGENVVQSQT
jgi:hypothetical protein